MPHGPLVFPALLYPVQAGMKVWREEPFGPVVPVARCAHTEEAIQYLINSDHGQQSRWASSAPNRRKWPTSSTNS
ncbi:aldehyde dehydrogenase family protein [Hymenobacter artigasi]|uniref:Acyl-CoA reductase-like NAD-dependent aldehyde dehydrogenase n=1 Tax=Hymenobacter artigasi TaxID=2719616 RepID=A0ABX1HCF9_9BACT|nr:aldehyde dehydrogenase family protein [Hymenobacter artigasi]NKI87894.1 acyl-CoA reductase-like NAD-dependent aldehyde dehydrogenase [Hymenobacter artigasi]